MTNPTNATAARYAVNYDNEGGPLDAKPFVSWFAVLDAQTGEEICRCNCVGQGELPERLAHTRATHICDLLNENNDGGIQ